MPPQDKTANGCIYCCDNEEPLKVKTESWPGRYSGVPKLYGNCTFDNYQGNEKLITELRNEKNNLVLRGNTGCGKTHLAVAILNTAKIENVHHNSWRYTEKKFITVPDLLLRVRSAFKDNSNESEDEIIKEFTDIPLLVLDDLGAEKTSEFVVTTLYIILDRRIRDCRKTIITTNLSQTEIEETFGARIASRLSSMENIKINMPDWRKKR
ncbi:MAG: ATP-binding protein [Candidatus Omnitrophica bacterium]|nr:ATP-binding protein [Candidatus Omnitrophota bacterium]